MKYCTQRLALRVAHLKDAAFIYELLNSTSWREHIGDRGIDNLQKAKLYIKESLITSYTQKGFGLYVMELLENQIAIGLCGLLKREQLDHVDIGFAILPAFAGKGYTYEAAKKVLEEEHYDIVYGITYEGNLASRGLLTKLGMSHIKNFKFEDYEEESMLYSLEKHEKNCNSRE